MQGTDPKSIMIQALMYSCSSSARLLLQAAATRAMAMSSLMRPIFVDCFKVMVSLKMSRAPFLKEPLIYS